MRVCEHRPSDGDNVCVCVCVGFEFARRDVINGRYIWPSAVRVNQRGAADIASAPQDARYIPYTRQFLYIYTINKGWVIDQFTRAMLRKSEHLQFRCVGFGISSERASIK